MDATFGFADRGITRKMTRSRLLTAFVFVWITLIVGACASNRSTADARAHVPLDYEHMTVAELSNAAGRVSGRAGPDGTDVEYKFENDNRAAWYACMKTDSFDTISKLCSPFKKINLPDAASARQRYDDALADSNPAKVRLWRAVYIQRPDLVKEALSAGANPNAVVTNVEIYGSETKAPLYEQNVLRLAVNRINLDVTKLLLNAGANPNLRVPPDLPLVTPGMRVIRGDRTTEASDVLQLVLQRGYRPTEDEVREAIKNRDKKWPDETEAVRWSELMRGAVPAVYASVSAAMHAAQEAAPERIAMRRSYQEMAQEGTKICAESRNGIHLVGFTERAANGKLQIRIAGIRPAFVRVNYEGVEITPGAIIWDNPVGWHVCEN